jgi:hypothetical protein
VGHNVSSFGRALLNAEAKDQIRLLLTAAGVAGLAIVLVVGTMMFAPTVYEHEIDWKWVRFGVVTVAFAAYCLKTHWRARGHIGFWAILLGVFSLHFLGVGYFYWAGMGLPLLIFGPVVALEWALLAIAVHHFLGIAPNQQSKRFPRK